MELFFTKETDGQYCILGADEAIHCIKVLRHKEGDEIFVVDGHGTMYRCEVTGKTSKEVECMVLESFPEWGGHPYSLTLAVCPTKNNDRYEWFAEKVTEIGVDRIVPIIGERSERKVFKTERLGRILVSAIKQSLKAKLPEVSEPVTVEAFVKEAAGDKDSLKLIAYCFESGEEKLSIRQAIDRYKGRSIVVMIGPKGDFSPEEAELAISCGFIPVHLGSSRLRTETAAVTAAEAVYLRYM